MQVDAARCHRLKKECRPSVTFRRRNPKKPVTSKSARLEEKLDGLVSLLKAGAHSDAGSTDTRAIAAIHDSAHNSNIQTNDGTSPYIRIEGGLVTSNLDDHLPNLPALKPGNPHSEDTLNHSSASTLYDAGEPSLVEAEEYLALFRTHKSKFFPFVHIPSEMTCLVRAIFPNFIVSWGLETSSTY